MTDSSELTDSARADGVTTPLKRFARRLVNFKENPENKKSRFLAILLLLVGIVAIIVLTTTGGDNSDSSDATVSSDLQVGLISSQATVPLPPASAFAIPRDGEVDVFWSGPSQNGGAPIIAYSVTVSGTNTETCQTSQLGCTVTGLTNGTAYAFAIVAINTVGASANPIVTEPVTPSADAGQADLEGLTVPDAPTNVTGVAGNGQVTINWSGPGANGGAPITSYTVTETGGEGTSCRIKALSCAVTGLTNGTAYTFTVVATNAVGDSQPSDATQPVTPSADAELADLENVTVIVPDAPTNVIGVAGNGQVTINWSGPGANGGAPITSYTVTGTGGEGATCQVNVLSCTITGLTNGTAYTFTVVATNAVGDSQPSAATGQIVPTAAAPPGNVLINDQNVQIAAPEAPTNLAGVAGNGQIAISWNPPARDGGSPITTYTVAATTAGNDTICVVAVLQCTITGLTNGAAYTFTVFATNAAGDSLFSNVGGPVIPTAVIVPPAPLPITAPAAPTNVTAVPGNGQATVNWSGPGANGGSPITGYTVTSIPAGVGQTCTVTATTCTVTGLTNGNAYSFVVVATNIVGNSQLSNPSAQVIPVGVVIPPAPLPAGVTVPDAPTNLVGVAGNGQVTLVWAGPANNGGSVITGYTVTRTPGGVGETCVVTVPTCTFTTLENGTAYTFTVVATNAAGNSANSIASAALIPIGQQVGNNAAPTAPFEPTRVIATPLDKRIQVDWLAPVNDGGSAITGYTVTRTPGGEGQTCELNALTCTFTNLQNGTAYTFTVVATNDIGDGQRSVPSAPVAPVGVPNPPTNLAGFAGNGQVTLVWAPPVNDGGSVITGYTVTRTPGGEGQTCELNALTCTFTNLENGTAYTFTVVATNAAGNSANSIASEAFTPLAGGPGAPTNIRVVSDRSCEGLPYENDLMASQKLFDGKQMYYQHSNCGNPRDTATISWDAPADTGGSPLIGYLAFKIDGPGPEDACGGPVEGRQSCTVDVVPGERYSFSVFAFSEPTPGQIVGTDSVEVDFVAQAAPASDFEVTLIPGDGNIRVNWDAAKQSGTNVLYDYGFYAVPARDQQVVQSVGVAELPQCVFEQNCTANNPKSEGVEFCFAFASGNGNLSCTIDGLINGVTYYVQGVALSFPADSPFLRGPVIDGRQLTREDLDALVAELVDGGGRYLNTYQGLDFDRAGSPWGNPDQLVTPVSGATVPNAPSRVQGGNLWNAEQYIINWEGNLYAVWNSPSTDGGARVESYRLEYFGLGAEGTPNRRVSLGTLEVDNYNPPLGCDTPTGPQGCNVILDHYDADYILYIGRKDMRDAVDLGNIYTERMFLLTARNSEGESSPLVSRLTDPGVPTNLTATLGDVYEDPNEPGRFLYNVAYTWFAPVNTGLPINDYSFELRIREDDVDNLGTEFSLGPCLMRGAEWPDPCTYVLETGIIWEYGVAAINEAGQGDYSEFITLFKETPTTATAPSAPTMGSAEAIDRDPLGTVALVRFDAPDDNGGSAITGYTITSDPGGRTRNCTATNCSVSGLLPSTSYTFTVTATNAAGTSPPSAPSNSVTTLTPAGTATAPSAPTMGSAEAIDRDPLGTVALVRFDAPDDNGGSAITGYTITSDPGGRTRNCTATNCSVSGLLPSTSYTFTVTATNAAGTSPPSAPSNSVTTLTPAAPATAPSAPTGVTAANNGANGATVSWTAPPNNGAVITGYTVTSSPGALTCTATSTSCTVSGLTASTTYTFTVTATNAVGTSSASAASASITTPAPAPAATAPGAVTGVTAVNSSPGSATVSWTAPADDGGSPITGYTVTSSSGEAISSFNVRTCSTTGALSCRIDGLGLLLYIFTVIAINDAGSSAVSPPSSSTLIGSLPSEPQGINVNLIGPTEVAVDFMWPTNDGFGGDMGEQITGYRVQALWDGTVSGECTTTGGSFCSITGLMAGSEYSFTVEAQNRFGYGTKSTPITKTMPAG